MFNIRKCDGSKHVANNLGKIFNYKYKIQSFHCLVDFSFNDVLLSLKCRSLLAEINHSIKLF